MLCGINCCRVPSPALQGHLLVWDSFPSHLPFLLRWRYRATRRHQRCCGHRCQCHLQRQNCKCYVQDSGKLSREKTFANFVVLWLYAKFFSANFGKWRPLARQKCAIPESFLRENRIFTNSRKFSPSKVSHYTVCTVLSSSSYGFILHMHTCTCTHSSLTYTTHAHSQHGQLLAMEAEINKKIHRGDTGTDVGFYESLLQQLKAHMARVGVA